MKEIKAGLRQCLYTMIHPVNGFDQVKWEKKGSRKVCFLILLAFFLVKVFDQVLIGFIFNKTNPDTISIPSIFLICMGGFAICFCANWAVSSLMFTEGEPHNIFLVLCYALVPYIFCELIYILATNFANMELQAFLNAINIVGFAWSGIILLVGMFYIHQLSFGKLIVNLLLTVVGILAVLFLILLGYSLVQQIWGFLYTIYNEIVFRL